MVVSFLISLPEGYATLKDLLASNPGLVVSQAKRLKVAVATSLT